MVMIRDLILKNRSYRRFRQEHKLPAKLLRELVDCARLSASAANLQPLRYITVTAEEMNRRVFSALRWAGYLSDWDGPSEGERPAGYIIILGDEKHPKHHHYDAGIAAQSLLLGAVDKGLGGCIFASVDREKLGQILQIPTGFQILLAIAIGKPAEEIILEETDEDGDIRYWRDENERHHVPKRRLDDVIIKTFS